MSKVADYLQEHVVGEVMTSIDARRYFATDASMFNLEPAIVVYPRNENDVRKTARFTWQLAERGRVIPLTARGLGSDVSGAALGSGIMLVFPAHQHRVLELDSKSGEVTVESGINYGKLQQTLVTHGRFLPCYPSSLEYSSVGGAVANNAAGERSFKYGRTSDFVRKLRVVLSNGEVIETQRLSKRELNKKLGLNNFEGELYRQLDAVIEENHDLILKETKDKPAGHTGGYAVEQVKRKDGSFDLTPLIVGSQGTLGLVTEVTMATEVHNPQTTLIMAQFTDYNTCQEARDKLAKLSDKPCSIDFVDKTALHKVDEASPALLRDIIGDNNPEILLFVEFDNIGERPQKKAVKRALKVLDHLGATYRIETEQDSQDELARVRNASATILAHRQDKSKAVPFVDDAIVPPQLLMKFIQGAHQLFEKLGVETAVWGNAGTGRVHAQPLFDIAELGDRQKIYKMFEQYYDLVIATGGVSSGGHGDGRLRGALLHKIYTPAMYAVFESVKKIFDPHGVLNPGVKIGVTVDDSKHLLRTDYDLGHIHSHMART